MADVVIGGLIFIAAGLVAGSKIKKIKNGESGCGCGCSGCTKRCGRKDS